MSGRRITNVSSQEVEAKSASFYSHYIFSGALLIEHFSTRTGTAINGYKVKLKLLETGRERGKRADEGKYLARL